MDVNILSGLANEGIPYNKGANIEADYEECEKDSKLKMYKNEFDDEQGHHTVHIKDGPDGKTIHELVDYDGNGEDDAYCVYMHDYENAPFQEVFMYDFEYDGVFDLIRFDNYDNETRKYTGTDYTTLQSREIEYSEYLEEKDGKTTPIKRIL